MHPASGYIDGPPTDITEVRRLTLDSERASDAVPSIRHGAFSRRSRQIGGGSLFVSPTWTLDIQPFLGLGERRQLIKDATEPVWSRDGRELFFRDRQSAHDFRNYN